jgi:hypothetical protein
MLRRGLLLTSSDLKMKVPHLRHDYENLESQTISGCLKIPKTYLFLINFRSFVTVHGERNYRKRWAPRGYFPERGRGRKLGYKITFTLFKSTVFSLNKKIF